jgi:ankyrin repeat protein
MPPKKTETDSKTQKKVSKKVDKHLSVDTSLAVVKPSFDSDTLTPKASSVLINSSILLKKYEIDGINVKRFSINPDASLIGIEVSRAQLNELEKAIFLEAISELDKGTLSAEQVLLGKVLGTHQPLLTPNNVVLVDILERDKDKSKVKVIDKDVPAIHTMCLWKMTDEAIILIDPSSWSTSGYLESPLQELFGGRVRIHKNTKDDKFYYSDPEIPGEYRDCIDIAVKIAIVLNEAIMSSSSQTSQQILKKGIDKVIQDEIYQKINFLSNKSNINDALGRARDNNSDWDLQSSKVDTRAKALETFQKTKEVVEFTTMSFTELNESKTQDIDDIQKKIDRNKEILKIKKVKVSLDYLDQLDGVNEEVNEFNRKLAQQFPTLQVKLNLKETNAIEDGIIVNKEKSQTSLHIAAMSGDFKAFKARLEEYNQSPKLKPFISAPDIDGQTALHLAASRVYSRVVELLIEVMEPKEIAKKTFDWKYTALHMVLRGDGDPREKALIVKYILEKASEIAAWPDKANQTALHLAANSGNREVVALLLPLMQASDVDRADVGWKGYTALHLAAQKGDSEIVRWIGDKMSPDALKKTTLEWHYTALHMALRGGGDPKEKALIVKYMLGKVPEIAAWSDQANQTALHLAAGNESVVVDLLNVMKLDDIVKGNIRDGYTALHLAVLGGHNNIIKLILNKAPHIAGIQDKYGQTPLHWAGGKGNEFAVRELVVVMKPDDIAKTTHNGKTALDWMQGKISQSVIDQVKAKMAMASVDVEDEEVSDNELPPANVHIGGLQDETTTTGDAVDYTVEHD